MASAYNYRSDHKNHTNGKLEIAKGDIKWFSYILNNGVLEKGFVFSSKPNMTELIFDISDSGNLIYNYQDSLENDFNVNYLYS